MYIYMYICVQWHVHVAWKELLQSNESVKRSASRCLSDKPDRLHDIFLGQCVETGGEYLQAKSDTHPRALLHIPLSDRVPARRRCQNVPHVRHL